MIPSVCAIMHYLRPSIAPESGCNLGLSRAASPYSYSGKFYSRPPQDNGLYNVVELFRNLCPVVYVLGNLSHIPVIWSLLLYEGFRFNRAVIVVIRVAASKCRIACRASFVMTL